MTSPPADDFYLAAHDGIGARALLSDRTLGVGLGSALIGELMFWDRLQLAGDRLHVVDPQPVADPALDVLLRQMVATPGPKGLARWVGHLAGGPAAELVEQRMTVTGRMRVQTKRRLLTSTTSLVLADPRSPGEPAARIRAHLSYNQDLGLADLMLAGLILATGLGDVVLDTCNPRDRARLSDQFRRRLPPSLGHLVAHARAAAGAAPSGTPR